MQKKDEMSEAEIQDILKKARKQQDDLLRQRNIERLRQDEELRKRLREKRDAKVGLYYSK